MKSNDNSACCRTCDGFAVVQLPALENKSLLQRWDIDHRRNSCLDANKGKTVSLLYTWSTGFSTRQFTLMSATVESSWATMFSAGTRRHLLGTEQAVNLR